MLSNTRVDDPDLSLGSLSVERVLLTPMFQLLSQDNIRHFG